MGRTPKTPRDPFGAWLHHLRTEKKLSQDELSDLTGISQSTLAYWERTGNMKGRKEIILLARAFGVSVQKLLRPEKLVPETNKGSMK